MSLSTLLGKPAGRHQERQPTRSADIRSVVTAIGDGQKPDPELVIQTLADNDNALDEPRTAVARLTTHCELRRAVDQQPHLPQERNPIDTQLPRANRRLLP
jgi:hypothetical protein